MRLQLGILMLFTIAGYTAASAQSLQQERFQCWGTYSNISQAPKSGDPSGLEIIILSRSDIFAVVGEGHIIGTKAKNITIKGNRITFDYWQNKFSAVCDVNGLSYSVFDERTGRQSQNLLLPPGSFITRKRIEVKWE